MTQPGWYPDQNGGPGMKYWDGQRWHDAALTAPTASRSTTPGEIPDGPNPPYMPPAALMPPAPLLPAAQPSSGGKYQSVFWVVGALVAIIVLGKWLAAIWFRPSGHVPSPVPSVSIAAETPASHDAPIDTPLTVQMGGIRSEGVAAVVVRGLEPTTESHPYVPVAGTLYSVNVLIETMSGTSTVNPLYFAARTEQGTNLRPMVGVNKYILPATELPEGQKVSGWLLFDVPNGQHIAEIVLNDPLGAQLGRWTVP